MGITRAQITSSAREISITSIPMKTTKRNGVTFRSIVKSTYPVWNQIILNYTVIGRLLLKVSLSLIAYEQV